MRTHSSNKMVRISKDCFGIDYVHLGDDAVLDRGFIEQQWGCIVYKIAALTDDKANNFEDSIIRFFGL